MPGDGTEQFQSFGGPGCMIDFIGVPCSDATRIYNSGAGVLWNSPLTPAQAAMMAANPYANLGPNPTCVQSAIIGGASATGLDLSQFSSPWVQIVGSQNSIGGTYGETELNFSGSAAAITNLIGQMCSLGFYNNGQCPGGAGNTPLVGGAHSGFSGNFRSPSLTDSVQVNTQINGPTGQIQIDVDPFNPAAAPILGAILHGVLQVIPNMITGNDTTYGCHP